MSTRDAEPYRDNAHEVKADAPATLPTSACADDAAAPSEFQLTLVVEIEGATDEDVAAITQEVDAWITEAGPSCEVSPVTKPGAAGAKGVLAVLGTLGLKFLEPIVLKPLIDCLAVYIKERRRDVTITVKAANGVSLEIHAGGIGHGEAESLAALSQSLLSSTQAARHA